MPRFRQRFALSCAGCGLLIAIVLVAGALATDSSEAEQGTMHNCPQAGKWAISVWSGPDGTETGEALAMCGEGAVDFAYYLDPETNGWRGYFEGHADISQLLALNGKQGVIAHGAMGAPPRTPTPEPTPGAGEAAMHNCPQAGKWAISVWDGADATETGEALATCGEVTVDCAYYLDPEANGWLGYFEGHADISQLLTLDDMQGIIAHGAMAAPVPTPAPTATPGTAGDVVLVSSNAFTTTSSFLVDGESRRMRIVGEIRNESTTPRSAGKVRIKIYDAANNVIGSRWTYAFDDIIMTGRTTSFWDIYPSLIYFSDETNDFPEGWTRYEISLSPRDLYPSEELPINVTVHDVQASVGDDGSLYVEGTVRNDDSRPQKWDGDVYAILYDQQDKILNVSRSSWPEKLQPGQSIHFEVTLSYDELTDYSRYLVQAYAEAE